MFARSSLLLLLLATAVGRAADPPPVPPLRNVVQLDSPEPDLDRKYPLPQDPARMKAVRAARMAAARALYVEPFEKHGDTAAGWAADARAAVAAFAAAAAAPVGQRPAADRRATLLLAKVGVRGDDPFVRTLHFLRSPPRRADAADRAEEWAQVLGGLAARKYPPVSRLPGHWRRSRLLLDLGRADEAEAEAGRFWATFAEAAAGADDATLESLIAQADRAMADTATGEGGRAATHARAAAALTAARAPAWAVRQLEGRMWLEYAWDARGPGAGSGVTPAAAALFRDRLTKAETALTAAWTAAPDRPGPADRMIMVCVGLGHDRATMEQWFRRAMEADPDDYMACWRKSEYLDPKWYGDAHRGEQAAFARQCARTGNHDAGLPLVLFKVYRGDIKWRAYDQFVQFYEQPTVRENLRPVLEGHLKRNPDDHYRRAQYAALCVVWKQKAAALGHLKALGAERPDISGWAAGTTCADLTAAAEGLPDGAEK